MDWMKDDGIFMPMINDNSRNKFFNDALAIEAPNKVVCDIGAGTGLLSVLALQAGAKHVIAVEQDRERCEYLRMMIDKLGVGHRVDVVQDNFLNTSIKADVYVSETINTQIFGENIIDISNHATSFGGQFIPGGFKIWVEAYENHPVFILDLSLSEAYEFEPNIDIGNNFKDTINTSFSHQYGLQETVYQANQLNRLFTMLGQFTDLKLNKLGQTNPVDVNLNRVNDETNLQLVVPFDLLKNHDNALLVVKWEAYSNGIVLGSDQCWFGNIAKPIRKKFRTQDQIVLQYDPTIKNWKLQY
jgi:hypothetical protein